MNQAMEAFNAAFAGFAVIVVPFAGSQQPFAGILGNVKTEHTAYVNGDLTVLNQETMPCGETGPGNRAFSRIYYITNMGEAQVAEGSLITNGNPPDGYYSWQPLNPLYSQGLYDQTDFLKIMGATGRGIGNAAAHEIGHQFHLPNMDCGTPDQLCIGTGPQSNFYEYYSSDGKVEQNDGSYIGAGGYLYVGAPLQWSLDDKIYLQQQLFSK